MAAESSADRSAFIGRRTIWEVSAGPLLAALLAGAFFLLLLWRYPLLCWKDDFVISILPVFSDVARAWRHGELPLLSPYSWACGNLAGEYQYGTFSPVVNLVAVVVDFLPMNLPAKAAALSLPHLMLLAAGACLLGQRRGVGKAGGVLVGVVAALNGWNIIWGATDWFGALAANAWLPWCWWAFEEALEDRREQSRAHAWLRRVVVPAVCVFLLMTGGFPYTVGMLAVVSAWLAVQGWVGGDRQGFVSRAWPLWPLVTGWTLGVCLAAPAWMSLLAYIPGSDRAHGVNVVPWAWTVPWRAWPALLVPSWWVAWPDFAGLSVGRFGIELAGGLVPAIMLATAFVRGGGRAVVTRCRWELGLVVATALLCMFPSPGLFRWSFRWLPLFHLAFTVAAVRAVSLAHHNGESGFPRRALSAGVLICLLGVTTLVLWLKWDQARRLEPEGTMRIVGGYITVQVLWVILFWAAATPYLSRFFRLWLPAAVALLTLWLTYTTLPINPGVPVYAIGQNIIRPTPLSPDRLYLCLSLEPYLRYNDTQTGPNFGAMVRPGSTSMFGGVHLINGYSPIMAAGVGRKLDMETHGNVPAVIGAKVLTIGTDQNVMLDRLGIDGLIVSFDYPVEMIPPPSAWERVCTSHEGTVYHRVGGMLPAVRTVTGAATITSIVDRRHSVSAEVDVPVGSEPAILSFRRPYLPGYRAALDGHALPVFAIAAEMPGVELPAGSRGHLELTYRPLPLIAGSMLAVGSFLAMIVGFFIRFPIGRWKPAETVAKHV